MDKIRGIYDQMGPEGQKQYHYKMLETKVGRKKSRFELRTNNDDKTTF
jgi:hypothetical protein